MDPMELGQRVRIIDGDHPHTGERGTVQMRREVSATVGVDPATAELPTPRSYVYEVRLDSIDGSGPVVRVNQEQIEPID